MSDKFESWILSSVKKLNLKIDELTWVREFIPNSFDIVANVNINSKDWTGHGFANTKDLALKKAVSEVMERAIALNYVNTSNGIASHTDLELAKQNALNELIERDLFLSHFFTRTPFVKNSKNDELIPTSIKEYIYANGDQIGIYELKKNNIGEGYVCLISNGASWGGILGLSFGEPNKKNELVLKAVVEAFRQYRYEIVTNKFQNKITLNEFKSLGKWTFSNHGNLVQDVEYYQQINDLFPLRDSKINESYVQYKMNMFSFEVFKRPLNDFLDCPLHVVRCNAEDIQQLLPGPFLKKNISLDGLRRFLETEVTDINQLPHPIK